MKRLVFAVASVALGITAVAAQQDPIKTRKELMDANGEYYYVTWNRMLRGQDRYDQAKVDAGLTQFIDTSQKLAALYPESSKPRTHTDKYEASLKIWGNKPDFEARIARLGQVAAENRGKVHDLATLRAARTAVGEVCDGCHERYQVKNR
jgi:cytochrome c556